MNVKIRYSIGVIGILSVVSFLLQDVIGGLHYPGYNPMMQAVSDLTATTAPSKEIASIFGILYGVGASIFSFALFWYFRGKINRTFAIGTFLFFLMNSISAGGYWLFPLTNPVGTEIAIKDMDLPNDLQNQMHIVVTIIVVVLTISSLILLVRGLHHAQKEVWLQRVTICILVTMAIGAISTMLVPVDYFGVAERINIYSMMLNTGILSVWVMRYKENRDEYKGKNFI